MTDSTLPAPPIARIIDAVGREATYVLKFPMEYDGKDVTEIRISRCTAGDVASYIDAVRERQARVPPVFPDLPFAIYQEMDDDDRLGLEVAADPFLPRRLKEAVERVQETGDTSSGP